MLLCVEVPELVSSFTEAIRGVGHILQNNGDHWLVEIQPDEGEDDFDLGVRVSDLQDELTAIGLGPTTVRRTRVTEM